MKNRYVLMTNIDYVIVNGVRTHTHALLLEERKDILAFTTNKDLRRSLRGFGTDPAMAIFDMDVPSIEYESVDAASPHIFIGSKGPRPLSTGVILTFAQKGPSVSIIVQDQDRPLDVQHFEKDSEGSDYDDIWRALFDKTTKYWRAPYMPSVSYGPPSQRVSKRF